MYVRQYQNVDWFNENGRIRYAIINDSKLLTPGVSRVTDVC